MNYLNCIKLQLLLVISTTLIVTYCAPLSKDSEATILSYDNKNDGKGNYYFRYVTSNGLTREETGKLVDVGLPSEHIYVEGSYSYIDDEGKTKTINYIANENGYSIVSPPETVFVASPLPPAVIASLLG